MRLRPLLLVAVLAVLTLVAAAVVAGTRDDATVAPAAKAPAATSIPETAADPVLSVPVDRYVALGDSYTAGPLIPWVRDDPPECVRSSRSYPAVLAQWLDAGAVVDASCSGADTGAITRPQQSLGDQVPPQLDAVTPDTDLVTVGIGGNDFGLFAALASGDRPADVGETLDRTGRNVAGALGVIQQRAPGAVVAVVGYPRIVPARGSCAALPFDSADNRYLDRVERGLNRQLRRAAAAGDAVYVDTYGPSREHDVCAGEEAWVNGADTIALRALAFHPFEAGMVATATALHRALRGEPPAPSTRRAARAALAPRPDDAFTRAGQRLMASLLGG